MCVGKFFQWIYFIFNKNHVLLPQRIKPIGSVSVWPLSLVRTLALPAQNHECMYNYIMDILCERFSSAMAFWSLFWIVCKFIEGITFADYANRYRILFFFFSLFSCHCNAFRITGKTIMGFYYLID